MKKLIPLIIILFVSSCYEDQDLGDGYYYLPPYEAYDIGYPANSVLYKSYQKYVFDNVIAQNNVSLIHFDSNWIAYIKTDSSKPYKERMNAYIINKKTDIIRGPYNKYMYNETVLNDLKLDSSFKWR